MICNGRCNKSYREALAAGAAMLAPREGFPVWCSPCSRIIREALRMLPLAYQALDAVAFMTKDAPERVSGSREKPSPAPGVDAQDEMLRTMTSWEDDLRHWVKYNRSPEHHWTWTAGAGHDDKAPLLTLERACTFLNASFDLMMEREECAADFGREVLSLFTRTQAMVKNGPQRRRLPVPCPHCDLLTLLQEEGIAGRPWYVVCEIRPGGCGTLYTPEEYEWWTEVLKARATTSPSRRRPRRSFAAGAPSNGGLPGEISPRTETADGSAFPQQK
jgi:hypothetical protein